MTYNVVLIIKMQFLSMKLAAVNPTIDFNIDDLFTKEVREIEIVAEHQAS